MTKFLPYVILAGVIIIFFVICYIMYSGHATEKPAKKKHKNTGSETQKKQNEEHAAWATLETMHSKDPASLKENTMPVPKISNVKVKERRENPEETGFVTTKGEVVHAGDQMYYEKTASKKAADDSFGTTQVISREEVLAAMKDADKNKAVQQEKKASPIAGMAEVVAADLKEKKSQEAMSAAAPVVHSPAPAAAEQKNVLSDETMIMDPGALKTKLAAATAASAAVTDVTTKMAPVHVDTAYTQEGSVNENNRTDVSAKKEVSQSPWGNVLPGTEKTADALPSKSIWAQDLHIDSPVVKTCIAHFLDHYGIVTPEMKRQIEFITAAAFQQAGASAEAERERIIKPFIVQDALQDVQKTYSAHPEEHVAAVALRAFCDVVHCPPTSTRHLVAINTLKAMPYLSQEHYRILAILLVFLYSRNSHNVDTETFRQYIDKYVMPFLERFPTERSFYQQLDYLHCTALETKETPFAEILADSYPLLFRYRGFTLEELQTSLRGKHIPPEFIIHSFNSDLYKLALVDEGMASRFFRQTGIADRNTQNHLLRLAKKHPTSFNGEEALNILEEISPVFADMGDLWDSTLLRVSTLSLLGLYLAQAYVKEIIGEEFDLSRWFE
jgi:hypothetical protein